MRESNQYGTTNEANRAGHRGTKQAGGMGASPQDCAAARTASAHRVGLCRRTGELPSGATRMMRLIVVRIVSIIRVTEEQASELRSIAQSRALPAGYVFRAKLILMLSEGATFATIRERLGTTNPTIIRWKERFLAEGLEGL